MSIEINLWFDNGFSYGNVNIDRGASRIPVPKLKNKSEFITQGVKAGYGTRDELNECPAFADDNAKYCWLKVPGGGYLSWNEKQQYVKIFLDGQEQKIPMVLKYRKQMYKNQPDISFRNYL